MGWLHDFVFGKLQPVAEEHDVVAEVVDPVPPEVAAVVFPPEIQAEAEEPPILVRLHKKRKTPKKHKG